MKKSMPNCNLCRPLSSKEYVARSSELPISNLILDAPISLRRPTRVSCGFASKGVKRSLPGRMANPALSGWGASSERDAMQRKQERNAISNGFTAGLRKVQLIYREMGLIATRYVRRLCEADLKIFRDLFTLGHIFLQQNHKWRNFDEESDLSGAHDSNVDRSNIPAG